MGDDALGVAYQRALGKAIKAFRDRLELSQDAFAERYKISTRYLRKIQSGLARPSSKVILPMMAGFNASDFEKLRLCLQESQPRKAAVLDRASPFTGVQVQ